MVRLEDLHPEEAENMRGFKPPAIAPAPWVPARPLKESRVALLTSAGLHRRDDPAFKPMDAGYRVIPHDVDFGDLVQSHVSVNFDRTAYQQDPNVVLPLERLHELAAAGEIGSVARWHYSVVGAQGDATNLEAAGLEIGRLMKEDGVDAAVLTPV